MSNTPGISPITPDIEDVRHSEDDGSALPASENEDERDETDVIPGRDGEIAEQTGP